ncbi:MAG: LemA family protein [Candidatus Woesearchaeota archaeon]|jgi:LemA protein
MSIIIWVIIILFLVALLGYIISMYNGLIELKNNITKSWANIDVLLKQRTDEIPNLISSVKGYMKHEKELLSDITKARTAIMSATTMSQKAKADESISGALKSIFAVSEAYPTLKANENFMQLQTRITSLENELADRREFYNDSVNNYNTTIQSFPDIFIAKMIKAVAQEMYKVSDDDKKNVKVEM